MIFVNDVLVNGKDDYFPDSTPAFNSIKKDFADFFASYFQVYSAFEIKWLFDGMHELFEVIAINDWIKEQSSLRPSVVTLLMPYIPNARMDRVKDQEVFTLKTFCNLINSCNFNKVYVSSAHSYVSLGFLNNVVNNEPIESFLKNNKKEFDTLFFPDEGALKRYSELKEVKKFDNIIFANKIRDWKTGKILSLELAGNNGPDSFKGKKVLFIDDIISRGGSLLFSAKELFKCGVKEVSAFITHTENVVDIESLKKEGVKCIYTTGSIYRGNSDFVKIVEKN